MSEIKKMDIKEFREFGFLFAVNHEFLHPFGLALEVVREKDGTEHLGGIWDYRDDPEGIIFKEIDDEDRAKIARVKEFADKKAEERKARLGYVIQPSQEER